MAEPSNTVPSSNAKKNWPKYVVALVVLAILTAIGILIYSNYDRNEESENNNNADEFYENSNDSIIAEPVKKESHHLDLAVEYNGQMSYFSSNEWKKLSSAEQHKYEIIGMVIDTIGQQFIVELFDKEGGRDDNSWYDAVEKYSDVLLSLKQAEALALIGTDRWKAKMKAYGGDATTGQWIMKDEYNSHVAYYINFSAKRIDARDKNGSRTIRTLASLSDDNRTEQEIKQLAKANWAAHQTAHHLDLAIKYDGKSGYFSSKEWGNMSSKEKAQYKKIGVVIDTIGELFILGLYSKEDGREMCWNDAMRKYSDEMPTKEQGDALAAIGPEKLLCKMHVYGGNLGYDNIWTKDEVKSSYAWYFTMNTAGCVSVFDKNNKAQVRPVVPLP